MTRISLLREMWVRAQSLGLSSQDSLKWIWSRWALRYPVFQTDPASQVQLGIQLPNQKALSIAIRKNGFDWLTVEEVFGEYVYRTNSAEPARRILDLGGNIGLAALYFAHAHPNSEVCTVEPMPDNLAVLRRNCELNPAKIRIIEGAVGPRDGFEDFGFSVDPRQHSSRTYGTTMDDGRTTRVRMYSMESLLDELGWSEVDLLKIDIEGGEADLLAGSPRWLARVRAIVGEGHVKAGYSINECQRDLTPMGFDVQLVRQSEGAMMFTARRLTAAAMHA